MSALLARQLVEARERYLKLQDEMNLARGRYQTLEDDYLNAEAAQAEHHNRAMAIRVIDGLCLKPLDEWWDLPKRDPRIDYFTVVIGGDQ